MDVINYSSSSEDEAAEKKDADKDFGLFGISDDEFQLNTEREFNYIKAEQKLDEETHNISANFIGPENTPLSDQQHTETLKRKHYDNHNYMNSAKKQCNTFLSRPNTSNYSNFKESNKFKCISSLDLYDNSLSSSVKQLILCTSLNGSFSIWDCVTRNKIINKVIHKGGCKRGLWFGDKVFSVGYDKFGRLFDLETEKEVFCCENENFVTSCCTGQSMGDNNVLLTGTKDLIHVWDIKVKNIKPVKTFNINCGQVLDFNFLPNLRQVVCCGDNVNRDSCERNLSIWDYTSGALLSNEIYHERYTCVRLKIDPTRSQFLAQTNGSYIAVFSAKSPYKMNKYKRYDAHKVVGYPIDMAFSPNFATIASGDCEGNVYLYNVNTANVSSVLNTNLNSPITSLVWNSNNKIIVGTWDGSLKFF